MPISEIKAYCEMFEIYDLEVKAFLIKFVGELDSVRLEVGELESERKRRLAELEEKQKRR